MGYDSYRISVKVLENGYEIEVPDVDAIEKRKKADSKKPGGSSCYVGDLTKSYAAKTTKEVIKLVTTALEMLPEEPDEAFEKAFEEAAGMQDNKK